MNAANPTDLVSLTVSQAAALIATRRLSSLELVDALLARIVLREPQVAAWAHLDPDLVRSEARARDAMPAIGPLHGVPIGIKDVIATSDQPTQCNSPIYTGHRPAVDAACVSRLRRAGAIIMGKTVTTEFAYVSPGPTRHPLDLSRTPGGSSSGSAAAVADGMVPAALGTQTGGSTIRPSAFCGVYGYKPGFGRFATQGLKFLAPSLDTLGVMCRDISDIALLSSVLTDAEQEDPSEAMPRPRLALFMPHNLGSAEPAAINLLEDVARRAGATCDRHIDSPPVFEEMHAAHRVIMASEVARSFAKEWREQRELLSAALAEFIAWGLELSDADIAFAWSAVAHGRRWCEQHVGPDHLLLSLPAAGEAPVGLQSTGDASFNRVWTALHAACLSVPAGVGPHGMPLGVQLIDVRGGEKRLLAAAMWLANEVRLSLPGAVHLAS
jgi:Asp-tRNA(Asn)/Glu-tRNA(Gln) amidotransferase A subunit family amidase